MTEDKDIEDVTEQSERQSNASSEKGLGRGLAALFGDDDEENILGYFEDDGDEMSMDSDMSYRIMPVDWIKPCQTQPRRHFDVDALKELADSIAAHGIIQPLLVRPLPDEDNQYEIIAGERRWRAAQIAQLHEVPVTIQYLADQDVMELALIENLQREDLTPLEEAEGYQYLMDVYGHTQEKLAASLGKSRSYIANMLRLQGLPDAVKHQVNDGKLSTGHARVLVGVDNAEELANKIIDQNLSVRDAERMKSSMKEAKKDPRLDLEGQGTGASSSADATSSDAQDARQKSVDILALEKELSELLGLSVSINSKGKAGELVIKYTNLDQMDDILHRLSHNPGRISING